MGFSARDREATQVVEEGLGQQVDHQQALVPPVHHRQADGQPEDWPVGDSDDPLFDVQVERGEIHPTRRQADPLLVIVAGGSVPQVRFRHDHRALRAIVDADDFPTGGVQPTRLFIGGVAVEEAEELSRHQRPVPRR